MNQLMTKHRRKYTLSFNLFFFVYLCIGWEYSINFLLIPPFFFTLGMNKLTLQKKMAGEVRVGAMDGFTEIWQTPFFSSIDLFS